MNVQRAQCILISATANRRARANYSDVSISGRGDRETVTLDRLRAFISVGHARSVAEIENVLIRQQVAECLYHGEPANAGIKNADGPRFAHAAPKLTVVTACCKYGSR